MDKRSIEQQIRWLSQGIRDDRDIRRAERERCEHCGNRACKLGLTPGLRCAWKPEG